MHEPLEPEAAYAHDLDLGKGGYQYLQLHFLGTLQQLHEQRGPGPHDLSDIIAGVVAATGKHVTASTACRIMGRARDLKLVTRHKKGRYALTDRGVTSPLAELLRVDDLLLQGLMEQTGLPALLAVPVPISGSPHRSMVAMSAPASARTWLLGAPLAAQQALKHAPQLADPAGRVILAEQMDARTLPDSLRIVRELSVACGRSPIPGHGEIAALIWRGSAVAGCVTLLVPNSVMTNEVRRRHLSAVVSEAAQRASLQNTLHHGERPRQLQAS
jgi:hypothetical protein